VAGHLDRGQGSGRLGSGQQAEPVGVLGLGEPALLGAEHGRDRLEQPGTLGEPR